LTGKGVGYGKQGPVGGVGEGEGLREGILEASDWDFIAFLVTVENDRQFGIEKAKVMGFAAEIVKSSVIQGYGTRMRVAKRIP
jgi:hypothetical protein